MPDSTNSDIDGFRFHFDAMYVGGIPRLLDETGAFLAFVAMLAATDTLAGAWNPAGGTGERFKGFVTTYFPAPLSRHGDELWRLRNLMIHAMNPGDFALVCGQSRLHLTKHGEATVLNAQDFYTALLQASQTYFSQLGQDEGLRKRFAKRMAEADGGAPETYVVEVRHT